MVDVLFTMNLERRTFGVRQLSFGSKASTSCVKPGIVSPSELGASQLLMLVVMRLLRMYSVALG